MEPLGKKWGRFEAVWLTDLSTQDIIQKVWKMPIPDAASCVRRQAIVFRHLKNWNALSFKSIQGQIEDIQARLHQVQGSLHTLGLHAKEQDLRFQLDILLQKQELYWAQRSKQHWLSLGDRNTKFFHRMAFWRRSRNRIALIQDKDGHVLTQPQDIQKAFVEHFQQLFSPSRDSYTESGPFPSHFNLLSVVLGFLNMGSLFKSLNKTFICLIPKTKSLLTVNDYRPISLCNRKKQGSLSTFGLKLDMNKAYDRVSWVFLEAVMAKMGCIQTWNLFGC
ncbi:hypothetical protein CsSME_00050301 [Camellia sinensis var. sinensis]